MITMSGVLFTLVVLSAIAFCFFLAAGEGGLGVISLFGAVTFLFFYHLTEEYDAEKAAQIKGEQIIYCGQCGRRLEDK